MDIIVNTLGKYASIYIAITIDMLFIVFYIFFLLNSKEIKYKKKILKKAKIQSNFLNANFKYEIFIFNTSINTALSYIKLIVFFIASIMWSWTIIYFNLNYTKVSMYFILGYTIILIGFSLLCNTILKLKKIPTSRTLRYTEEIKRLDTLFNTQFYKKDETTQLQELFGDDFNEVVGDTDMRENIYTAISTAMRKDMIENDSTALLRNNNEDYVPDEYNGEMIKNSLIKIYEEIATNDEIIYQGA